MTTILHFKCNDGMKGEQVMEKLIEVLADIAKSLREIRDILAKK